MYNQADATALTSQQKALEAQDLVRTLESTRQTRIDEKAAEYEAVNAADTNAVTRHRALVRLIGDDLGYRWFYIVIIVTLLVVDLTPLLLKLFGPHTPYLENARRDAARLRARTTVQVIEGAKGEADAQYDLDDRKHRNRANIVAHAGDLDEREHRNRMDSLTREHEHTLADVAAKHAVAQTREALHKLSDESAAAKDLADHYLKTAFAHLKERRHRPSHTHNNTRATQSKVNNNPTTSAARPQLRHRNPHRHRIRNPHRHRNRNPHRRRHRQRAQATTDLLLLRRAMSTDSRSAMCFPTTQSTTRSTGTGESQSSGVTSTAVLFYSPSTRTVPTTESNT